MTDETKAPITNGRPAHPPKRNNSPPVVLPTHGTAIVKSALSGDTVILLGRIPAGAPPGTRPPEVLFTFERVTAPRMASKSNNNVDDPGAFSSREFLRRLVVGKPVSFETRRQGATAGDRVYGLLFLKGLNEGDGPRNLAVESVTNGWAIPKVFGSEMQVGGEKEGEDEVRDYERALQVAFSEAKTGMVGVHSVDPTPLVRNMSNAGDGGFSCEALVESLKQAKVGPIQCVIEYIFDGSKFRLQIVDERPEVQQYIHGNVTLIMAGVSCPRTGSPRLGTQSEEYAEEARHFVEIRLLHRELAVELLGVDKNKSCVVGNVLHPRGSIGTELLKNGLGRMSDWTGRMMDPAQVPALRAAETVAKRGTLKIWKGYTAPKLSGDSEIQGTVVEVLTGDTVSILPNNVPYTSDLVLKKVSMASVRSPRLGNEKTGKVDEPYAAECKQRLINLTIGKQCRVTIDYEREIPLGDRTPETRQFGTIGIGKREDVGAQLVSEGLAETQRHRDNDEKSSRYDELVAAEHRAKELKKNRHSDGDTVSILPNNVPYTSDLVLKKVSMASVRSPRLGNEKTGKVDEPYAAECKQRLINLTIGKQCRVTIDYEREIPLGDRTPETRQFGTIGIGKREDVGAQLVSEGLAETQRHRDNDEKSCRYDEFVAAEHRAKELKKNRHSDKEYTKTSINDLSDPRKAQAYAGSLISQSRPLKAIVDYVFNGSRYKLTIPSENCTIVFALEYLRCPQAGPPITSTRKDSKKAEPFGDESKRHAKLRIHQRTVEIIPHNVTKGGVITGQLFVGGGAARTDIGMELLGSGLARLDQIKVDYGEVPKHLLDAQTISQTAKKGIWSLEDPEAAARKQREARAAARGDAKPKELTVSDVTLSEIRDGSHFFFHTVGDASIAVMEESMKLFTKTHGTVAPGEQEGLDVRPGKIVAALFNDGAGKSWYRAKILGRPAKDAKGKNKVEVLFIDHGNVASVPVETHLRILDEALGTEKIPAIAKEAKLALISVRSIEEDDGYDAANFLQELCWGKELKATIYALNDDKQLVVSLASPENPKTTINVELVKEGLARRVKDFEVKQVGRQMSDGGNAVVKMAKELKVANDKARKGRMGMWRYGDVGDDDEEERKF
eukprot:CAMPEP_0171322244 /NCGR_PEP_ID=MMETSP0816-20121228/114833_1 /TAXON_ID=420281 /ORGANISM="Proboscia inermis, Strain CCAP1064/1" /LENGTH=1122 /DNA_ID=CAMNT_0011820673 /DNA_START=70 /DNA_END=3438 /DNA_ORIENTATION=+